MALTKFPIEVTEPTVEVVLPVGTHVLELVVEDSAGLKSAPAAVVVTVQKEAAEPSIKDIAPKVGKQGATLEATITGENLKGATSVEFIRAGQMDAGIVAKIKEATDDRIVLSVQISNTAEPGVRDFTVTTPAGTAKSATPFVVVGAGELPIVEGIEPDSGKPGDKFEATIYGANLEDAGKVVFLREGEPDDTIEVGIEETSPEKLLVVVGIRPEAPPGKRDLIVTTPAGTSNAVPFVVVGAGELTIVEGIEPDSGKPGDKFEATIYGANLEDAGKVVFLREGEPDGTIEVGIEETSPEKLLVVVGIRPEAPPGVRDFTVTTPAGTAQSPLDVTFTVEGEVAGSAIKAIEPESGEQGATLEAAITGENLKGATAVEFFFAGLTPREVLSGIVAEVKEATADRVVVGVRIAADAEPGARNFRVTTPAGTAQSPAGVFFTVLEAGVRPPEGPVIEGIVPTSGQVGGKVEAVIGGVNLGDAKNVTFFIERLTPVSRTGITPGELPEPDKNIQTEIARLGSTDTALRVVITISESAELGLRGYAVETAGGIALGPEPFTVEAGGLVPIRTVEEVSGIGPTSEARLAEAGVTDLGKLAAAKPVFVAETLGISEERALEFVVGAKRLLGVPEVKLSGRSVEEVPGIGPASAASLAGYGITDLAEVGALEPATLAKMLETTEARAKEFIGEAQRLLG